MFNSPEQAIKNLKKAHKNGKEMGDMKSIYGVSKLKDNDVYTIDQAIKRSFDEASPKKDKTLVAYKFFEALLKKIQLTGRELHWLHVGMNIGYSMQKSIQGTTTQVFALDFSILTRLWNQIYQLITKPLGDLMKKKTALDECHKALKEMHSLADKFAKSFKKLPDKDKHKVGIVMAAWAPEVKIISDVRIGHETICEGLVKCLENRSPSRLGGADPMESFMKAMGDTKQDK